MIDKLYNYYFEQREPQKSCLLALRDIILKQDANITETMKYGMPCFCYKKKMFCYLWIDRKTSEPYILFFEGRLLKNPELETGDRARMKILRVNAYEDLPLDIIELVLNEALDLYRNGIVVAK